MSCVFQMRNRPVCTASCTSSSILLPASKSQQVSTVCVCVFTLIHLTRPACANSYTDIAQKRHCTRACLASVTFLCFFPPCSARGLHSSSIRPGIWDHAACTCFFSLPVAILPKQCENNRRERALIWCIRPYICKNIHNICIVIWNKIYPEHKSRRCP